MCKKILNVLTIFIITIVFLIKNVTVYAINIKEEIVQQKLTDNYITNEIEKNVVIEKNIEEEARTEKNTNIKNNINTEIEANAETKIDSEINKKIENDINKELIDSVDNEDINSNMSEDMDAYSNNEKKNIRALDSDNKTIEEGIYTIKSFIDKNYVIDVSRGSIENEANIQLYISNDTEAQKFRVKYINEGYYEIESVRSGKVLDVKNGGKSEGTNIWQYEHNGTDSQRWMIVKNSDGTYSIISKLNDLYVDVLRGRAQNEQNIQVYSGNETKAQKFIFEKNESLGSKTIENGTYIIKSAINENFVLDVSDNSKKNGANIQLFSINGTDAQKFNIKYINNGYYSIIGKNSNKSLEVKDSSKQIKANVWQMEYKETDAQKWIIKDIGNGYFSIISKCNGLYIDVNGARAQDYTNIQMYEGNGTNAQKFKLLNIDKFQYSEGTYGQSGLKIQGNSNGRDLKYYKIGSGPNVFFATFAIHGWEDDFEYDGQELTKIAEQFKDKLISMNDIDLANKWTIYIFPSLNPDGEYYGWTHNGPGRTTLYSDTPEHKGIDMNRTWSTDWVKYTTDRNYTGTEPFQAYEARYLRDFLLSHKSTVGQTVLVDLHGWLNETMGDDEISSYYRSQLGMSKHISSYGRGYLINWARANLGANGRTARTALIELPEAYSSADVSNWRLADKYINATINMLRNI